MAQHDHSMHGMSMDDHAGHEGHDAHGHDGHGSGGHDGHGEHGGEGNGMNHMMMKMFFHFGYDEVILFDQWRIDSPRGLILSFIVIAAAAVLYEGLKYYREFLFWKTYNSLQYRAVTLPAKGPVGASSDDTTNVKPKMTSFMHIFQTFLHILQVTLSFLLMLVFMTYNVWLCMSVVVGAAIGYFLFGWKKSVIVDITEHCH